MKKDPSHSFSYTAKKMSKSLVTYFRYVSPGSRRVVDDTFALLPTTLFVCVIYINITPFFCQLFLKQRELIYQ